MKLTSSHRDEPGDDDAIALDSRWTGDAAETGILAAESEKATPESLAPNQIELSVQKFHDLAPPDFSVISFLAKRDGLRRYEPWLERDAFSLYYLHNGLNRGIFEVSGGNYWLFLLPEV